MATVDTLLVRIEADISDLKRDLLCFDLNAVFRFTCSADLH